MSRKRVPGWLLLLLVLGLTGCGGSIRRSQQPEGDRSIKLDGANGLGQTFTAQYDGLDGVIIRSKTIEVSNGEIVLHLRQSPLDSVDLRTSRINLSAVETGKIFVFPFDPVNDSAQEAYFFSIEIIGKSQLAVRAGSPDSYLNGAMYVNGIPHEAQLQFGLSYSRLRLFSGLLFEIMSWLCWLLVGLFLFFLPGWGLLRSCWMNFDQSHWVEKIGLSLGVSLAIYPILMVLVDIPGFHPGAWFAFLPGSIATFYWLWLYRAAIKISLNKKKRLDRTFIKINRLSQAEIALVCTIVLLIFARFWAIREIEAPMWGDSVHHTAITQLILDNGGLFTNWEPYSPHQSFSMHFGFSAQAAVLSWLTGQPAYRSVLIAGQLINIIAILTLLPLGYRLYRRNLWGVNATLIAAGLLSPMPAFYVNWGRYSQLAGQAIIPVGIFLMWNFLDRVNLPLKHTAVIPAGGSRNQKRIASQLLDDPKNYIVSCTIIGLVLAGMMLTSYRLIIFFMTFLPGFLFVLWLALREKKCWDWRQTGLALIFCGSAVLIFLLPWFPRLVDNTLPQLVVQGFTANPRIDQILNELRGWLELRIYQPWYLIAAAAFGLLWSIIRRQWDILTFGLWVLSTQLFHLGRLVNFPGANMIQVFAILIWLYLPISLLVGSASSAVSGWVSRKIPHSASIILMTACLTTALLGANQSRLLSRPHAYAMVTRPDLIAMAWIRDNTPEASVFLVEGSLVENSGSFVGTDAGWWLPLLARRDNTIPPQYAYGVEEESIEGQMEEYVNLVKVLEEYQISHPTAIIEICKHRITHVYIGQRQGRIGASTQQLFAPEDMISTAEFSPIYHQDRVYIFRFTQSICK